VSAAENYPAWSGAHASLTRRVMTPQLYEALFGLCTKHGFTIDDAIQGSLNLPVMKHVKSAGCLAGDDESYAVFAPFFDEILKQVWPLPLTSAQYGWRGHPPRVVRPQYHLTKLGAAHPHDTRFSRLRDAAIPPIPADVAARLVSANCSCASSCGGSALWRDALLGVAGLCGACECHSLGRCPATRFPSPRLEPAVGGQSGYWPTRYCHSALALSRSWASTTPSAT
jgi:hypothetical protein